MPLVFGKVEKIEFEGPYILINWTPPMRAGLYVILKKPYPVTQPDEYKEIYFGESGNLSERGFVKSHHSYDCWMENVKDESDLFIGIYYMPGSTDEQREEKEKILKSEYFPPCPKKKD